MEFNFVSGILLLGFACGRCNVEVNVEVTSAAIFFFWMGRFMEKSGKMRLPKTWALTTLLSGDFPAGF